MSVCVCVCVCVPEGSAFSFSHPLRIVQPWLLVLLHSWPNIYSRCSWGEGSGPYLHLACKPERQRHMIFMTDRQRETETQRDRETETQRDRDTETEKRQRQRERQRERERERERERKVALACAPARLSLQAVRLSCFKNCILSLSTFLLQTFTDIL